MLRQRSNDLIFILIEFKNDFDLIMKFEINFHLRTCENVML